MATGRKINKITDLGTILQAIFADLAGTIRMAESGLDLTPVGSITAEVRVNRNTPVLVYNSTGADLFVAFGVQGLSAPADAAAGVPVLANQTAMLNSGDSIWIRGSAAGLFAYTGDPRSSSAGS